MKKIIKYATPSDGSIPDFVYNAIDGVANFIECDGCCLGISVDNPIGVFEPLETKSEVFDYLCSIQDRLASFKSLEAISQTYVLNDPGNATNYIWTRLVYLRSLSSE